MIKTPLLLIVLLNISIAVFGQSKWQLVKDDNGTKVYVRRQPLEKFKEVRAIFELDATEEQLVSVLQDVPHHNIWSDGTKRTDVINRKGKDTTIYYSEVGLPWPFANRDLVIELTFRKDTVNNLLHIQAKSIPGVVPRYPDLVRVPYSLATWDVTPMPDKKLRIEYILSTDPGGAIPGWLVNLGATVGPVNSFRKLKEIINKRNHLKTN